MKNDIKKRIKKQSDNLNFIVDKVLRISKHTVVDRNRRNHGEIYWILCCITDNFKIFPSTFDSWEQQKDVITNGSLLGKTLKMIVRPPYRHVVSYDILESSDK